jgi:hypothetical protein
VRGHTWIGKRRRGEIKNGKRGGEVGDRIDIIRWERKGEKRKGKERK